MKTLSVSGRNWILKNFDHNDIRYIKENFSLDEITSRLLSIRKIKKEEINSFLNPSIKNFLPNPNILEDMEKSTLRTYEAIINEERIGIFGDYDVDGASSTALLGNYFSEFLVGCLSPDLLTMPHIPCVCSFVDVPIRKLMSNKGQNSNGDDRFVRLKKYLYIDIH